jgi:hypothetical protein
LLHQVGQQLGQADGVLVFDPSAFPKSGHASVGVARQWCGRLGKVDNCQVAIYLGYVSAKGHTLVDMRLYLPKDWTQDKARLDKAGVPQARRGYHTRHQLALAMLEQDGPALSHGWIAGDDEMGRPYWFRRRLATLGERYMLAVPSNTLIRDLETAPPEASGRSRRPQRPWQRVDQWAQAQGDDAWRRIDVRDGAKGPLVVDVVKRRVLSRTHRRQQGHEEMVVDTVPRSRQPAGVKVFICQRRAGDPVVAVRPRAKPHRIEECLQRSRRSRFSGLWSPLDRLAPSSNAFASCYMVSGDGNPAGEKNGHPRSRYHRFVKASR